MHVCMYVCMYLRAAAKSWGPEAPVWSCITHQPCSYTNILYSVCLSDKYEVEIEKECTRVRKRKKDGKKKEREKKEEIERKKERK